MMSNLLPYFIAFSVAAAGILLIKPLALRLGLVDEPGGRKSHEGKIPLIGGIAMFLGFSFALLTLDVSLSRYRCLIAACFLLAATGLLDDFHELTPRARLFVQILAGVLMVWWGDNSLKSLGDLFSLGQIKSGYFSFPLTVFAVAAVINAVNMIDGADGLAGSVIFIEFFYLSLLCYQSNLMIDKQIIDIVLSVLLGFLFFNFPFQAKASVFMGDSGSMMLGFLLVWFCVYLSQSPHLAARPIAFLWIMAVPLWDISSVVFQRIIRGFSPFSADRRHLHHGLLEKGFSSLQVTITISLISGFSGLIGVLGEKYAVRESILFAGFLFLCMFNFWGSQYYFLKNKSCKNNKTI